MNRTTAAFSYLVLFFVLFVVLWWGLGVMQDSMQILWHMARGVVDAFLQ